MPYATDVGRGLTETVVRTISASGTEPSWMVDLRLKGLRLFECMPLPAWGADFSRVDFDNIGYFGGIEDSGGIGCRARPTAGQDTPEVGEVGEVGGAGEAGGENPVAGLAARYQAEGTPGNVRADLVRQGVVFVDTATGLKEHPEVFRRYFGSVVGAGESKFAALNTAVWSGGSFVYVPPGVHVEIPLQAFFTIDMVKMGLFERTLIVVDEGADVHYVEGCTAAAGTPAAGALHAAVVEVVVKKDARCRYTAMHWSRNVYNVVTKRAVCHTGATMEWVDASVGATMAMKCPVVWMLGEHARGVALSVDVAWAGQHQDVGATMVHAAPHTSSRVVSKSVVRGGGRIAYRGLVQVNDGAHSSRSTMATDALQVDMASRWHTRPTFDVRKQDAAVAHTSGVSCVGADQLYYLMSRGLSREAAAAMVVRGFVDPIARELPVEYQRELSRVLLAEMQAGPGAGSAGQP